MIEFWIRMIAICVSSTIIAITVVTCLLIIYEYTFTPHGTVSGSLKLDKWVRSVHLSEYRQYPECFTEEDIMDDPYLTTADKKELLNQVRDK